MLPAWNSSAKHAGTPPDPAWHEEFRNRPRPQVRLREAWRKAGGHSRVTTWTAVVTASRAHYDAMVSVGGPGAGGIPFPGHYPERRFTLNGPQMRIGRSSISLGIIPEIDLTGPPADPGISRLHAILIARPDGSWAVVDAGSENGTTVNSTEIPPQQPVPLNSGDTICIGAWTAITILTQP